MLAPTTIAHPSNTRFLSTFPPSIVSFSGLPSWNVISTTKRTG